MTFPTITPAIEARFWARVDKRGPDECWPWIGSIPQFWGGYGKFSIKRGSFMATRATHTALAIDGRPRTDTDHHALHSCNNPPCVNPNHLRWGTKEENIEDMRKKNAARRALGAPRKYTRHEPIDLRLLK